MRGLRQTFNKLLVAVGRKPAVGAWALDCKFDGEEQQLHLRKFTNAVATMFAYNDLKHWIQSGCGDGDDTTLQDVCEVLEWPPRASRQLLLEACDRIEKGAVAPSRTKGSHGNRDDIPDAEG